MGLFSDIVRECLITEAIGLNDDNIKDAINKVVRVRMVYNDNDRKYVWNYDKTRLISPQKGKAERYILPVAYGLTKSGKRAVRAYETAGSTRRGGPHWKLFLVDNIVSWANGKRSFKNMGEQLIEKGFNPDGDKGFTTLYAYSPIGNGDVMVAKDSQKDMNAEPLNKSDVQPTAQNQNPSVNHDEKFVPSQANFGKEVDNAKPSEYFNDKVESPETAPITKSEIAPREPQNQEPTEEPTDNIHGQDEKIGSEPLTKSDIEDADKEQFASQFKDLTNRMDNLYKDTDEDEKEEGEE